MTRDRPALHDPLLATDLGALRAFLLVAVAIEARHDSERRHPPAPRAPEAERSASGRRLAQLAAEAAGAPGTAEALQAVRELRRELDDFERDLVAQALAQGRSYAAVGRSLGLSRQAVHRRFRGLSTRPAPLPAAPELRLVLRYAREAAATQGTSELRSEHVLLGVLRAGDLPAAAILREAGATLERVQAYVRPAASSPPADAPSGAWPQRFQRESVDLHALLATPVLDARRHGAPRVEVEHLLAAVLEDPAGGASRILRALSAEPRAIRARLAAELARASVETGVR